MPMTRIAALLVVVACLLNRSVGDVNITLQYNRSNFLHPQCLGLGNTSRKRRLIYKDQSTHPVVFPYPPWTSGQVLAQIAFILLSEVMNYDTDLFAHYTSDDGDFVNFAAGCSEALSCLQADVENPLAHFTLETWPGGDLRLSDLPDHVKPVLLRELDYSE